MSLLRRRAMMISESEESMKEWKLLDIVDFAGVASKEYDIEEITEIFLYGNLLKCESDVASGMSAKINNIDIGIKLDTAKSSANGVYQYAYAKYNGLFWEVRVSSPSISKANISINSSNAGFPYSVKLDVGTANKLKVGQQNPTYPIASGTLEIYVR